MWPYEGKVIGTCSNSIILMGFAIIHRAEPKEDGEDAKSPASVLLGLFSEYKKAITSRLYNRALW